MQKQLHIQFPPTSLFSESAFQSILTILISLLSDSTSTFLSSPASLSPFGFISMKSQAAYKIQLFTSNPVDPTIIIPRIKHHYITITSFDHRYSQASVCLLHRAWVGLAAPVTSSVHPKATLCSSRSVRRALYEVTECQGQCWPRLTLHLALKETAPLLKETCDAFPAVQLSPNVPL